MAKGRTAPSSASTESSDPPPHPPDTPVPPAPAGPREDPYTGPPGVIVRRPGDAHANEFKPGVLFPRATRLRREFVFEIKKREPGKPTRIDRYLQRRFEGYSRTFLQGLIREGRVLIDDKRVRPATDIVPGQIVKILLPGAVHQSEDIPFDVLYEDANMLVIDKPAGVLMHPARGHSSGTLYNGLLNYFKTQLAENPAQHVGIVHRLDQMTSGVLVVMLKRDAHKEITRQFETRLVRKEYLAVVHGAVAWEKIANDKPIGVDPDNSRRYFCDGREARSARTEFECLKRSPAFSLIRCLPRTGRSHQIRVHLMDLGHPILGDALYGGRRLVEGTTFVAERYLLHAQALELFDPDTGKTRRFEAPIPEDMQEFIDSFDE